MGGNAAWDIALAHPDLWAGVIPIAAAARYADRRAPEYVSRYWPNAKTVPLYFVGGSMDTDRLQLNTRDFERYLTRPDFDTVIVEYLGRGHEHFHDEILRIFDWIRLHARDFSPTEFETVTMRPWDRFFWWVEVEGLPSAAITLPGAWPASGRPATVEGTVQEKRNVRVKTGARRATVWLSPQLVNFEGDVSVTVNGRKKARNIQPSVEVMLEDARLRGDRQHPFWAKVEVNTGRG